MKVVVIDGDMAGEEFPVNLKITRIGRSKDVEIQLTGDKAVSRRHAVIKKTMGQFVLEDLGSANGTFLLTDDEEVEEDQTIDKIILVNGRKFMIGETVLQFVAPKTLVDVITKPDGSKLAVCNVPEFKRKKKPPPEHYGKVVDKGDPDKRSMTRLRLKPVRQKSIYNIQNAVFLALVLMILFFVGSAAYKAATSFKPESKPSPLHRAVAAGNVKVVELLLWLKNDPDARDSYKNTAMHTAVELSKPKMVEILIENGGNVNAQNEDGNTPLHLAASMGDDEIALLLIQYNARLDLLNEKGHTPLDNAIKSHSTLIVEMMRKAHTIKRKTVPEKKSK